MEGKQVRVEGRQESSIRSYVPASRPLVTANSFENILKRNKYLREKRREKEGRMGKTRKEGRKDGRK